MEIIFHGKHDSEEAAESLLSILRLFKERYHINSFRDMHLTLTLVDQHGDDVELINSDTAQVYRFFEVYRKESQKSQQTKEPLLHLVIDNTSFKEQ